jgi:hypothetical protein
MQITDDRTARNLGVRPFADTFGRLGGRTGPDGIDGGSVRTAGD